MAFTHTITRSWQGQGGTLTRTTTCSAEAAVDLTIAVPDPSANKQVVASLRESGLVSLYMLATKDMTVAFNDVYSGSPDGVVHLKAQVPYIYTNQDGTEVANPLEADLTALHITLTGSGDATLEFRALHDATP